MRIGLIAPPWLPSRPLVTAVPSWLSTTSARGLQALGHDVRLFTVGESTCPVPLKYLYPAGIEPMDADVPEAAHVLAAYEALADVDIIHDHTALGPLVAGPARDPPAAGRDHQPRAVHPADPPHLRRGRPARLDRGDLALAGPRLRRIPIAAVIHHGHRPGGVPAQGPGTAVTCCSWAGCAPIRECTTRYGLPGAPDSGW